MIKAVLFDVDNTLLDFMRMKQTAVELSVDYMINAGLEGRKEEIVQEIFEIYRQTHIESQKALEEVIRRHTPDGNLDYKILASGIIGYQRGRDMATYPYPKVEFVIKELIRRGLKVGAVSDAPAEQCYNRLARLHLIHWLDVIITYDDTKEYKPSVKPFLLALEKLQYLPCEVLYVGDWPEKDIIGAKAAGLLTAFARWGEHPEAKNTGADYEINSIEEVLNLVKKQNENN
ncbi:MAG: HAD-IA family hydrolase [Elusimicrobiota bacterium]|nr:HAD-IA family hydrolase [Elusimicrobiota bacterium]